MQLKKSIPFILAGIVFGLAGTLLFQKWQEPSDPIQQFADLSPDQFYCVYSFDAFEILQKEDLVSAEDQVKIANFPAKTVELRDTLSRVSYHTVPKRQTIKWTGKIKPTLEQIQAFYQPYVPDAKLYSIEDLTRDKCFGKLPDPDDEVDPN